VGGDETSKEVINPEPFLDVWRRSRTFIKIKELEDIFT